MARKKQTRKNSGCLSTIGWLFLIILLISIVVPNREQTDSNKSETKSAVETSAEDAATPELDNSESSDTRRSAVGSIVVYFGFLFLTVWVFVKCIKRIQLKKKIGALVNEAEEHLQVLTSANSMKDFVHAWKSLQRISDEVALCNGKMKIKGVDFNEIKNDTSGIEPNFQEYIRNTIERQKKTMLYDILIEFKDSKELKEHAYWDFMQDLDSVHESFSEETKDFADSASIEVYKATGLSFEPHSPYSDKHENESYSSIRVAKGSIEHELHMIDHMEGHDFENYCAELLKKNGFANVHVTRGSGDQGVDILAENGGVRYAIQCKCYTSDLGNKPIQEVHAGKTIYNCHVGAVLTNRYFTPGAIKAAESTNTLLWDRDKLVELLKAAATS